ncbi:MAG: cytosine deaminase [Pseudomonadota bacterium]
MRRWADQIPASGPYTLADARVPAAVADGLGAADVEGFVRADIGIDGGKIGPPIGPPIDIGGAVVLPAFVDCHTHLDKGQIWARKANPDGTFGGAIHAVRADRTTFWTAEDVRTRMDFMLRCAYAHGTRAVRTHLDTGDHRTQSSWAVFREMREVWAGRIALQAVALVSVEQVAEPGFAEIADLVASSGGVMGGVTYPMFNLDGLLDQLFDIAGSRGLSLDLHVDESLDPGSATLRKVAEAKARTGFDRAVTCGHCCSLAMQPETEAMRTIERVAAAGIAVISLPLCNLYLQDRAANRTPRARGVTLVHELAALGVPVAFASDNTRDPFYAYGDLDMLEVMREATRIAHLDHPVSAWPAAFSRIPAAVMGIGGGVVVHDAPADLVLVPARGWTELLSRPHPDRLVIRDGRAIAAEPPDYAELDGLAGLANPLAAEAR